jgi:peptidoglycan/xylan/chitin deacetylase (PgdA/CDA1 family)
MYHYVRPIKNSKFQGIKGLELEAFKRQLDYLIERYNVVSANQVIDAYMNGTTLPDNACWLTFDDGYKDHYKYVLPELINRKLDGAFFPPRAAIEENILLDVNSIHHILSCTDNVIDLVTALNMCCRLDGLSDESLTSYRQRFAIANRFDDADTIYVKRMLQHALPENLRNSITAKLFEDFVGISAQEFSKELYMSIDEVSELVESGMYVGSHGSRHYWLDRVSAKKQEEDITRSIEFLDHVNAATNNWVMCYPYGAYNDTTLSILKKYKASLGLTTEVRVADISHDNPYTLPRLDTNDFPQ